MPDQRSWPACPETACAAMERPETAPSICGVNQERLSVSSKSPCVAGAWLILIARPFSIVSDMPVPTWHGPSWPIQLYRKTLQLADASEARPDSQPLHGQRAASQRPGASKDTASRRFVLPAPFTPVSTTALASVLTSSWA